MHFWCKTSICPYRNPFRISFICSEWYDRETFKKHLDLLDIHLYMVCWMTSLMFRKQDCHSHFMVYFYSWTKKISSNLDKYGMKLNLNFWQDVCDFCWWRRHFWWMKYSTRCWVAFAINLIIWYARCMEREQCQAQAFYLWSRCLIKWKFQTDQIFRSFTYTYKSTHHFLSLDKNDVQIL